MTAGLSLAAGSKSKKKPTHFLVYTFLAIILFCDSLKLVQKMENGSVSLCSQWLNAHPDNFSAALDNGPEVVQLLHQMQVKGSNNSNEFHQQQQTNPVQPKKITKRNNKRGST